MEYEEDLGICVNMEGRKNVNIYWDHIKTGQTYSMTKMEESNLMPLCKEGFAMIIRPLDGGGTFLAT